MKRRTFLKIAGIASASTISAAGLQASALAAGDKNHQTPALQNEILKKLISIGHRGLLARKYRLVDSRRWLSGCF